MSERFEAPAALLGPVRWRWLALPAVVSAFAAYLAAQGNPLGFLLQILAFVVAGVFVAQRPRPRSPSSIRVDDAGSVHLGARQFAVAGDLAGLLVTPHGQKAMLTLERFDGERVELELDSTEHLRELQACLRAGTALSSTSFRGHVPYGGVSSLLVIGATVWMTAYTAITLGRTMPVLTSILAPFLLVAGPLGVATLRTWSVELGAEGARLRKAYGWPRRARLVPYRELTVQPGRVSHHVALLRDGVKLLALELGNAREARSLAASVAHRSQLPEAGGGESSETQLARGDRSVNEWLETLQRRIEPGYQSYRIAALPVEELWAVLENPEAAPSARIGAALTLRLQEGAEPVVRQRLAVASRATALPEVRSATAILAADEPVETTVAKLTRTLR